MAEKMQFTEDQKKAIETRGKNILVAAAAGSGKTRVALSRRYAEESCPWIISLSSHSPRQLLQRCVNALRWHSMRRSTS